MINKNIRSISITSTNHISRIAAENNPTAIFTNILTVFKNLSDISFDTVSQLNTFRLCFGTTLTFASPTLMKLHVKVRRIDDCLYFLDGRFNQLQTFHVNINFVDHRSAMIHDKVSYFRIHRKVFFSQQEITSTVYVKCLCRLF